MSKTSEAQDKAKSFFKNRIKTLDSVDISNETIANAWGDKRYPGETVNRLLTKNREALEFLGISYSPDEKKTYFTASSYVGAAPLLSPANGKSVTDIVVHGRYGEDFGALLSTLQDDITNDFIEYHHDMTLVTECQLTPPTYIECCKFINLYPAAERLRWRKFINTIRSENKPSASTLWNEYATRFAQSPDQFNTFRNKRNITTTDHPEWRQLNYVLSIAINTLSDFKTPSSTRIAYYDRVARLRSSLYSLSIEKTTSINTHASDPAAIKALKAVASNILNSKSFEKTAWRVDCAMFFERFVQHVFNKVASRLGATCICNTHFPIRHSSFHPSWSLAYLEPDIVISKDNKQYIIDAKYKSHLLNASSSKSDDLKESFRHDLHQVLAYSSFSTSNPKHVFLVYPTAPNYDTENSKWKPIQMEITSPLSNYSTKVALLGIPMQYDTIKSSVDAIVSYFQEEVLPHSS